MANSVILLHYSLLNWRPQSADWTLEFRQHQFERTNYYSVRGCLRAKPKQHARKTLGRLSVNCGLAAPQRRRTGYRRIVISGSLKFLERIVTGTVRCAFSYRWLFICFQLVWLVVEWILWQNGWTDRAAAWQKFYKTANFISKICTGWSWHRGPGPEASASRASWMIRPCKVRPPMLKESSVRLHEIWVFFLRCRVVVDNVGDHVMPEQSVFCRQVSWIGLTLSSKHVHRLSKY